MNLLYGYPMFPGVGAHEVTRQKLKPDNVVYVSSYRLGGIIMGDYKAKLR